MWFIVNVRNARSLSNKFMSHMAPFLFIVRCCMSGPCCLANLVQLLATLLSLPTGSHQLDMRSPFLVCPGSIKNSPEPNPLKWASGPLGFQLLGKREMCH